MSLSDGVVSGLVAVRDVLPANPYLTSGLVAAVGAAVIVGVWTLADPNRRQPAPPPVLRPPRVRPGPALHTPVSLLGVPLGVIPRDVLERTPYEAVGLGTISAVVEGFYASLGADPDLAPFFARTNMSRLRTHQALFVEQLWGGPAHFPLQRLIEAHQDLNITAEQYWRLCGHLMVTLTRLNVPDWICVFTMTRLYQTRHLIVARSPAAPAAETES